MEKSTKILAGIFILTGLLTIGIMVSSFGSSTNNSSDNITMDSNNPF